MEDVVIVSAARTPVGSFIGAFGTVPAHKLGEVSIRGALERAKLSGEDVSEVIMGQILTAGQGMNPARQASIAAGLPIGVSDRKSTRLNSSHLGISYAVFCLTKKNIRACFCVILTCTNSSSTLNSPYLRH